MENKKEVSWIEASELPESEKVYLKKDFLGWRVIEPWKNENGSTNWFVILTGGKRNLLILIFILLIVAGFYFGVHQLIESYQAIASSPCDFCNTCKQLGTSIKLNLTGINLNA